MSHYTPELGQFAFRNPTGEYEVSDIGEAAIASLLDEIRRVYWNHTGRRIDYQDESCAETWNGLGSGIEWHAYWWGGDDTPEAERSNLTFGGVEIRWYKYPGRGESVDREMAPDDWASWLTATLKAARAVDFDPTRSARR